MSDQIKSLFVLIQFLMQRLAVGAFIAAAVGLTAVTAVAAFGAMPWLQFSAEFNGVPYDNAGQIVQVTLTAVAVLLCFFIPMNGRIMRLETSHRRFELGMQDIARAYVAAHGADREGLFQLSSEFDAVRERLAYLRDHPDLGDLEPALLEVAAQMSFISKELAEVYSDEKVNRARAFLTQRQQEIEAFNTRLEKAKQVCQELHHWAHEVELEESVAASQLQRLRDDLRDILPEFGHEDVARADGTIVSLTEKAAE
ncbi:DNA repair protein [Roseovarius sp. A21]|uniref:DNA repair protein n=1 Tax=Roseovarius bejariae TaxID=2576383 RepID=A0A844CIA2_9RHOB|nr:DNA repair protein [Roseovarius bejariae]MRU14412.1 DNA repair protein [Roseovarius bejariae]